MANTTRVSGRKVSIDLSPSRCKTDHLRGGKDVINFRAGEVVANTTTKTWHYCSAYDATAHELAKLPSGAYLLTHGYDATREITSKDTGEKSLLKVYVINSFRVLWTPKTKSATTAA